MLLIDTNIFLEVMLAQSKRKACASFLNAVKENREKAAVTDFTIFSLMVILDGRRKLRELDRFLRSLSAYKGLTLYATSLEDKVAAVELAASGEFDVDDAIQYASATSIRARAIVSLDRDFDNHEIPRIEPSHSYT
jgi:predicted nucleic acid-binding protein